MSDFAGQCQEAINESLRLWEVRYPNPWPVIRALVEGEFFGEGGEVYQAWLQRVKDYPDWVEYTRGLLIAGIPAAYTQAQIMEALSGFRRDLVLYVKSYLLDGDGRLFKRALRAVEFLEQHFPEVARECDVPKLVLQGGEL